MDSGPGTHVGGFSLTPAAAREQPATSVPRDGTTPQARNISADVHTQMRRTDVACHTRVRLGQPSWGDRTIKPRVPCRRRYGIVWCPRSQTTGAMFFYVFVRSMRRRERYKTRRNYPFRSVWVIGRVAQRQHCDKTMRWRATAPGPPWKPGAGERS